MNKNLRWSQKKADLWYRKHGWIVGANFIPSTAINQLEMWQAETFDPVTINTELGYAKKIGFNTVRVFLHNLLWEKDRAGFIQKIDEYLKIADKYHIKTIFVLLDGVWDPYPKLGKQQQPKPYVHNSGWVQSPGLRYLTDKKGYSKIKNYIKGVISAFANDKRVLMWDIFNEPDNLNLGSYGAKEIKNKKEVALKLLTQAFGWAREINPSQPITSGAWESLINLKFRISDVNNFVLSNSDVISFHSYENKTKLEKKIVGLKKLKRPIICTEYLARPKSNFKDCMTLMKKYNVGCLNWGLVSGKTQTIYPWSSWIIKLKSEPKIWFHDIFKKDGSAFDEKETKLIKDLTS